MKHSAHGLNPTNDTATELSRKRWYNNNISTPSATRLCAEWNKAKQEDPTLEYRITFVQWKKEYMKNWRKKCLLKKKK